MPAFTAIGIYVATAITGTAFVSVGAAITAGAFAFAAVATITTIGAAYITSRLINGNQNKGSNSAVSEGGRIQLPPATNNKIPVTYGETYINGVITDARITDENKTMYYCLVLGEKTQTGTYTIEDVYKDDLRLIFEGAGSRHRVNRGVKSVDGTEDFENSFVVDSTNLLEVRVYAGGTGSASQIFPTSDTPVNAYDYWDNGSGTWTASNEMAGLIFAIVKVRYNTDKGLTNIPNWTFKVKNTLDNPAAVWRDYMTSVRYGAGVASANIPTGSGTAYDDWYNYCDELIRYTDKDAASATQRRYTINGVVDTSRDVKTNIDSILQSGGAWLSYDVATGYWRPIIKQAVTAEFTASRTSTTLTVSAFSEGRIEPGMTIYDNTGASIGTIVSQTTPLTAGESTGQVGRYTMSLSGAVSSQSMTAVNLNKITLEFDDENITSGITINSSSLTDLYNSYETEFFDRYNQDQRAYTRASINSGDRNPNEPDNALRLGLEFVNNSVQADILSNIELRQSRDDLVINFTAAHYGIQAQAGDVIKIVNSIYGWNPKYFRVMRVKEIESEEGSLLAQIEALEYNGDTYTIESITEFTTEENIGIIPFQTTGTDTARIQTPEDDRVSVTDNNQTAPVPNIVLAVKIPTTGGPYDEIQVWYGVGSTSTTPANNAYTLLQIHKPPPPDVIFNLGRTLNISSIASDVITSTAHGLDDGDQVYYFNSDSQGLTENKLYYVRDSATDTFKLSLLQDGTAVSLTNGTTQISATSITSTTTINFPSAHGLSINDEIIFTSTTQQGLTQNTRYYVISTGFTTTAIQVATTKAGSAITLTNGTGLTLNFNRLLLDTCHAIIISGLPANQTGQKYYFKVRVCSRGVCSEFTDPDGAVIAIPEVEYEPDASAGSASVLNIKEALLKLDFGTIVIPNNGFWLWRTTNPVDFGSSMADNYILDLGLTSVTENTVSASTDIETFIWQADP